MTTHDSAREVAPEAERLAAVRARIDALDLKLRALLNERARLAQEVGHIKNAAGHDGSFYRPAREAQVLRAVLAGNPGPLGEEALLRIYREIIAACLALEKNLTVAYLGPAGTYTEAAVRKHFGQGVATTPLGAVDEVFREVEAGSADCGVVAVENSTEGVVTHTLDMFARSELKICAEIILPVHHCLLGRVARVDEITELLGHAQALAQCREWLDRHLPGVPRRAVASNAEGARQAAGMVGIAAVAGRQVAPLYGLDILAENIEDEPDNTTRFLVIGREQAEPSGRDKTSLMVAVNNRPGALFGLLEPFHRAGVSLTRIESRPSRRSPWDYNFFLDLEGHAQDAPVAAALTTLAERAAWIKHLGSYPVAVG
ncbi:MAG: prephenate dehydratase [Pseudomonadota bacterium]